MWAYRGKKRSPHDHKQLILDYQFLHPDIVSGLCWNYLQDFSSGVGPKTALARHGLGERLDTIRQNRYSLGHLNVSKEYRDSLGAFRESQNLELSLVKQYWKGMLGNKQQKSTMDCAPPEDQSPYASCIFASSQSQNKATFFFSVASPLYPNPPLHTMHGILL